MACAKGSLLQANHGLAEQTLCDCLVFWSHKRKQIAAAVEIKSRAGDAKHAVRQLASCARQLSKMVPGRGFHFCPVLLHHALRPAEFRILLGSKVEFRGRRYPVIQMRCDHASVDAILQKDLSFKS